MPQDPKQPSWKGGANKSGLPTGKATGIDKQHSGWKQGGPDPSSIDTDRPRKLKIAGLIAGFIGLLVAIVVIIWALQPPVPVLLVVVGPPDLTHATDLSKPLNAFGPANSRIMLEWGTTGKRLARRTSVFGRAGADNSTIWPIDAACGASGWLNDLAKAKGKVALIYVACHGGCDDTAPILFGESGEPVPLSTFLGEIKEKLKRQVFLVLDVTQLPTDWRRGQLTNEFVDRLPDALKKNDDPNLIVLTASSAGERSWGAPEFGLTIFTKCLVDALTNAPTASGSEQIFASDVHAAVKSGVDTWVRNNRAEKLDPFAQTPQLLLHEKGKDFLIAYRDSSPPPSGRGGSRGLAEIEKAWSSCEALAAMRTSPAVYTPRAWRRYRELLLRYEQVVRSGADGSGLLTQITSLEASIKNDRGIAADALLSTGVNVPAALGRDELFDQKLVDGFLVTRAANAVEGMKKVGGTESIARMKLCDALLRKMVATPEDLTDPIAFDNRVKQLKAIDSGGSARPVEAHLPIMLNHYAAFKLDGWKLPPKDLLKLTLDTRLMAERAALMAPSGTGEHPYSERLPKLLADRVNAADTKRRQGEDLLFASASEQGKATELIKAARDEYVDIIAKSEPLRTALRVRDEVFADLPFLCEWVAAARPSIAGASPGESADRLVKLWAKAHELAKLIARGDPLSKTKEESTQLGALAKEVSTDFVAAREEFLNSVKKAERGLIQSEHREIELLLQVPVPLMTAAARKKLLDRSEAISRILQGGSDSQARGNPVKERELNKYQGRLAAAQLGADLIADQQATDLKLKDVSLIETEPRAAWYTGLHYQKLIGQADKVEDLPHAEQLALLAGSTTKKAVEPALAARDRRWAATFERMGRRAVLDHWYNESTIPLDYSNRQALAWFGQLPNAKALETESVNFKPFGVLTTVDKWTRGAWSTQPSASFAIDAWLGDSTVARTPDNARKTFERFQPGYGVVSSQMRGNDIEMEKFGLKAVSISSREGAPPEAKLKPRGGSLRDSTALEAELELSAWYRGQIVRQRVVKIPIDTRPDLTVERPEAGKGAQVAARADADLSFGNVAIVFDCSGSMTENGPTKFRQAKEALERLLSEIPKGTNVAVYTYGNRKEDVNEVFKLRPLAPWTLDDRAQFFAKEIFPLPSFGYTPLMKALARAAVDQDFRDARGQKTIIALTDGCDQLYQLPRPNSDVAKEFQKTFLEQHPDVAVHMILFLENDATGKEELATATQQFNTKGIDALRPINGSSFEPAANVQSLTTALRIALRPRVKLKYQQSVIQGAGSGFLAWGINDRPDYFPDKDQLDKPGLHTVEVLKGEGQVFLRKGEHILFMIRRGADKKINLQRQILADDPALNFKLLDGPLPDGEFALSVVKKPFGGGTVKSARFGLEDRVLAKVPDRVEFDRAKFAWWEFHPVGKPTPRRSTVRIVHNEHVPTWEVDCNDWTDPSGTSPTPAIDVWCSRDWPDPVLKRVFNPGEAVQPGEPKDGFSVISAGFEPARVPGIDGVERPSPVECFVLRLNDSDRTKRYVPYVHGGDGVVLCERHEYFPSGGSTHAFQMAGDAKSRPIEIRVVSVSAAKEAAKTKSPVIHLRSDRPAD